MVIVWLSNKGDKVKKLLLIGLFVLAGCTSEQRIKDPEKHISPFGRVTPTTKERSPNV